MMPSLQRGPTESILTSAQIDGPSYVHKTKLYSLIFLLSNHRLSHRVKQLFPRIILKINSSIPGGKYSSTLVLEETLMINFFYIDLYWQTTGAVQAQQLISVKLTTGLLLP